MTFNFDRVINRRQSYSAKWNRYAADVLPMWVADMDFASPAAVREALAERVGHGVFGYHYRPDELYQVIQAWLSERYDWHVKRDQMIFVPGVVFAMNLVCRALTRPGQGILVEPPVYPPLLRAAGYVDCQTQAVPLIRDTERYVRDLQALEGAISEHTRLLLLCNPHNPVGRVFERRELEQLADICLRHDLIICSDEIHCDLIYAGHDHTPIASLAPEIAARAVTLFAPSKSFNIPGLGFSVLVAQDPEVMERLQSENRGLFPSVDELGMIAAMAAYREGADWLDALAAYLEANRNYLLTYCEEHMPDIDIVPIEGTFLAWLDCRGTAVPGNPQQYFLENAKVALNDGPSFGAGGEGFVRLNFGCPRSTLMEGLARMHRALVQL